MGPELLASPLSELLDQLVQRGWPKLDAGAGRRVPVPGSPWWSIELGDTTPLVTLHPWQQGLLEFTITVLADQEETIQSFELECNAMPIPVALINWWGGLDAALLQAGWLRDQLMTSWEREISQGAELP